MSLNQQKKILVIIRQHSKLCSVTAFSMASFGESEILYIFPTLRKNWVNLMFLITQPNKQSHFKPPHSTSKLSLERDRQPLN